MLTKTCSRCQSEKPQSAFGSSKRYANGLFCWCRTCVASYAKQRYAENPEKHKEFARNNAKLHKAKKRARDIAWRDANRDHVRARDRKRYERDTEKRKASVAAWAAKNPERRNAIARKWASANPENRALHSTARSALKRAAVPAWADLKKVREFYAEARRLEKLTGDKYHVDHIVPLTSSKVCGLHCEANLQVLPYLENIRKRNHVWPDMPEPT